MSNLIQFNPKVNSLTDAVNTFALAVYNRRPTDFEDVYTYTETYQGRTVTQQLPPIKYIAFVVEVYFVEQLIDQVEDYEAAAQEALTKAVDCGHLTLAGEALYQSILSVALEVAAERESQHHETD